MQTSKRILTALLSFGMAAVMGQTLLPAQTNTTTPTNQPAAAPAPASESGTEFQKGEFNLSPFGAYSDQVGGKWGAGLAGTYFITDKIGLGGATYWTETGGTFIDNLEFEGYFRIPLKKIAPYAVASLGYQFDYDYWFQTIGGGLDFRAFRRFDAFSDVQWRISDSDKSRNGALLRVGVRFNL